MWPKNNVTPDHQVAITGADLTRAVFQVHGAGARAMALQRANSQGLHRRDIPLIWKVA
jgi:hypothetical protein